jgi:hypothetical protein
MTCTLSKPLFGYANDVTYKCVGCSFEPHELAISGSESAKMGSCQADTLLDGATSNTTRIVIESYMVRRCCFVVQIS